MASSFLNGDPNRTSFELQLNSKQVLWLAGTVSADDQRTRSGRSADAQRTLGRRSRSARIAAVISGDTEACRSCASASMAALTAFFAASEACVSGAVLRECVSHRRIGVVTPVDRLSQEPPQS